MEKIKGDIVSFRHKNPANGYTVLVLRMKGREITCVGHCRDLEAGETIEAEGEYFEDPVYGKEFRIASYEVMVPTDRDSIERYLGSGAIKGIGPTLAARIVDLFGEETLEIIENDPERLAEVKGISKRSAMEIAITFEEKKELRNAMIFLGKYSISQALAIKIYDTYGAETYAVMKNNPYKLAEDIRGVGFITADNLARKMGMPENSPQRLRCGLLYIMQQSIGEGHCYLPIEVLRIKAAGMMGMDSETIEHEISGLAMDRKLIVRDERVYLSLMYYAELNCARLLGELNMPMERFSQEDEDILLGRIKRIAVSQNMEVDPIQLEAVKESIRNSIFILSGGPGTGKTTTINLMIGYFLSQGLSLMLAAPTGRAAKRMSEATGYEAMTIHRLLEVGGGQDDDERMFFQKNEENPLETDVLIIDEASMVDILLFQGLLRAIVPGTRLILVGDAAQLPSVGPGEVLRELIESGAFPCIRLERIFRQAAGSDIVVNAHRINKGEQIRLDTNSGDFLFLERNDSSMLLSHMVWMMKDKLPGYCDAQVYDIQVLTPMRKGNLGCVELNRFLQEKLNPPAFDKHEHISGEFTFREGDKVMQVRNNYKLEWSIYGLNRIPISSGVGVFNGDTGRIVRIDESDASVKVEFDDKRVVYYPFNLLEELEPAYAVTIHKSQGSEYPAVIIPLLDVPDIMRYRNLLYTGVTRGKKCVVILGKASIVREMIGNEGSRVRYTSLKERIGEVI